MSAVFSSWKNLRRTPYQSFTALLVVVTTFFMAYIFTTFLYFGEQVLNYFESQPQILVFFETYVTDAEATQVATLIAQLDYVASVEAVLKTQAMHNYMQDVSDQPLLTELLTPELFPASLKISASSPSDLERIRKELDKIDDIDEVDYRKEVIEQFLQWTNLLRNIGLATCALLTVQFILVIMIITSMKVISRRRSINIMSLLGAGRFTIKRPFVVEGMWLGVLGSLLAFGGNQLALYYLSPAIIAFVGKIPVLPLPAEFLLMQIGLGTLASTSLASLSSWLATSRLIKK